MSTIGYDLFTEPSPRACCAAAQNLRAALQRRRIGIAPLQAAAARGLVTAADTSKSDARSRRPPIGKPDTGPDEMLIITVDRNVRGGADAILFLAHDFW